MDMKRDWSWMGAHMPAVVAQIREFREAGEGEHLDACWRRGVLQGEPNWFWACEGRVAVGTPFTGECALIEACARQSLAAHGAVLMLAPLGRELRGLDRRMGQASIAQQIVEEAQRRRQPGLRWSGDKQERARYGTA